MYVAPLLKGIDINTDTLESPYATIQKATSVSIPAILFLYSAVFHPSVLVVYPV
jgi:hypothetical protein